MVLPLVIHLIRISNDLKRKANKIWVEKGSEFYDRSMKSWLEKKWHRNVFNTQ